jgi:paired amphipathic helix protein Sin3a
LTVQLLGKEDHISDDALTAEEKWTFYVDQFVQLSANEKLSSKNREPFLRRNLPNSVDREPPQNVETKSGLELKICMNTYKIFFVDNTEDYFYRKKNADSNKVESMKHEELKSRKNRHLKLREWIEGEAGWKKDGNPIELQSSFEKVFSNGLNVHPHKSTAEAYKKYARK